MSKRIKRLRCGLTAACLVSLSVSSTPNTGFAADRMIPLSDLRAGDRYKGEDGGLYGKGSNVPPKQHLQAAIHAAGRIRPRDAAGKPDPAGKIGFISVGMSNTTQEFSAFTRMAVDDPTIDPAVVIVDGAQGGMEALSWAQPDERQRSNRPDPWDVLSRRLRQPGLTDPQVQAAWVKLARRAPAQQGEYPRHANEMRGHFQTVLQKLKQRFPNLQIAYLSSRIYAGYATTQLNPEPYAYESAFVVRRLILDQIEGKAALNCDSTNGAVKAPLLLWGPYLWADGDNGRKTDRLVWQQSDFAPDGTHPGPTGRRKVAELLLQFMKTDPSARAWFAAE